jgi:hypothetical protein
MNRTFAPALFFFAAILLAGEVQDMPVLAQNHNHETHDNRHTEEGAHAPSNSAMVEMQITIRHSGYELRKDGHPVGPDLSLIAGRPVAFSLRNEDSISHEFISSLFTRIELHFTGRATGIFRKEAAGFRLNPGESLTVQFMAPFSDFPTMYDLIWCTHHREHLIVVTEDRPPSS